MDKINQYFLDELVKKAVKKENIWGFVIRVENTDLSLSLMSSGGNIQSEDYYFIASVTKLYVTTIILQLRAAGRLQLDYPIKQYLSSDIMSGLHIRKGIDYSSDITIRHLMSNTTGIRSYFTFDIIDQLASGHDQIWPLEKTLDAIKQTKPRFKPGQKGRALYSDTNYQLLGKIIENITNKPIGEMFKHNIFDPLQLEKTYVYENMQDTRPVPLYFQNQKVHIPKYMTSVTSEGGIVSTARDTMIFLKAFFNGQLFSKNDLSELTARWNLLFGPGLFFYGTGISKQPITAFDLKDGLLGLWGQSGAFAFYHPKSDLYFTGTVNQFSGHSTAARMMIKLIKQQLT